LTRVVSENRKCAKNFAAETFACEADGEMS
jgi:hypothetical protein